LLVEQLKPKAIPEKPRQLDIINKIKTGKEEEEEEERERERIESLEPRNTK
jgi:hypothetical protein